MKAFKILLVLVSATISADPVARVLSRNESVIMLIIGVPAIWIIGFRYGEKVIRALSQIRARIWEKSQSA